MTRHSMRSLFFFVSVFILCLCISGSVETAFCADKVATWVGGVGNWSEFDKWDIGEAPNNNTVTYDVIINNGTVTLDSDVTVEKLIASDSEIIIAPFTLTTNDFVNMNWDSPFFWDGEILSSNNNGGSLSSNSIIGGGAVNISGDIDRGHISIPPSGITVISGFLSFEGLQYGQLTLVPEPISSILFLLGSAVLGVFGYKRKRA